MDLMKKFANKTVKSLNYAVTPNNFVAYATERLDWSKEKAEEVLSAYKSAYAKGMRWTAYGEQETTDDSKYMGRKPTISEWHDKTEEKIKTITERNKKDALERAAKTALFVGKNS